MAAFFTYAHWRLPAIRELSPLNEEYTMQCSLAYIGFQYSIDPSALQRNLF